jgi:hypothetical protein
MRVRAAGRGRLSLASGAAVVAVAAALALTGCGGGAGSGSAVVPSLGPGRGAAASQANRGAALRAAAQCVRQHGIPGYQEPVLTATGQLYTDTRSLQYTGASTLSTVQRSCGTLLARAALTLSTSPSAEPPAPAQLVQAGVRAAECFRAHGIQHFSDPTAQSPYVPGHGFQLNLSELPPGSKANPFFQQARQACASEVEAELRASTLASLGNDG